MARPTYPFPDVLARYRALVDGFDDTAAMGAANPYTATGGNMFSYLDKSGGLCLRLSKPDREAFWQDYGHIPVESHGAAMREYVAIPEAVMTDSHKFDGLFGAALQYARSLKVKPSKRR